MGCDTDGIVITTCKDVKIIASLLTKAIWKIPVDKDESPFIHGINNGNPTYNPHSDTLSFNFVDGKDKRNLFVCLDCDSDHINLGENSISMILGCWGNSVELMKLFLGALSPLGDCYLHENDAVGEPVKVN